MNSGIRSLYSSNSPALSIQIIKSHAQQAAVGRTIMAMEVYYNCCPIFEMRLKGNKFAMSSRFKEHYEEGRGNATVDLTDCTRYKTEEGQSIEEPPRTANSNKSFTCRKITSASLENLLKKNNRLRKLCLQKVAPQHQPIPRSILSPQEKENVRKSIIDAISNTPPKRSKQAERQEKLLRSSFQRVFKQIKQRTCICRVEQGETQTHKIEGHAASIKGEKHNVNQDSLAFCDGVYVICDGHGTNGKQISEFVCTMTHKMLQEAVAERRVDGGGIRQALKKVQLQLDLFGIDIAFSGCTLVAVVISENTLFTVNVGDSRALLCRGLTITDITTPHRPDHPVERQRIELCGGVIRPLQIGKDKFSGPNRIWAPGRCSWGPGLALSRAFGDKAARKFGVISQAEIRTLSLTYDDDFIILGSDGLFDCLKPSELCFAVRRAMKEESGREEVALKLVEEARRAAGKEGDDVSCIVVLL